MSGFIYKSPRSKIELIVVFAILGIIYIMLGKNIWARDFNAGRRDITVSSNAIENIWKQNKEDMCESVEGIETIEGIEWYIDEDVLYIKSKNKEKRKIIYEKFYDCPWNRYEYKKVKVDGGIGVKLWYFNKGKARKCKKI